MHGFGRYLAAALAARFASEGMGMAVVLLALERTGSAAYGAYVLTAWLAPHVLAAPLAGAAAARARRPRLFYVATLAGFTTVVAALAVLLGRAPVPVVIAVAVLGGGCGPMVTGGLSSLVAGLVPPGARRDRAYGWDASTYNAAAVTAPAVVSLVAALASAAPAMAVLAASGALAATLAASLPYEDPGAAPLYRQPGAGLGAGLAALWRVRELRAITSATTLAFVGIGSLTTTSVLLAAGLGSPGAGGVLMTAFAVGALTGSLTLGRITAVEPGRLARWGMAGTGVALAAAALSPSLAVTAVLFAAAGVCDGPLLTATLRIRSEYAPDAVRTQVFTLGAGLKLTAASAGAALVGLTADAPAQALLGGIAALQLAAALLHALAAARRPVEAATEPSAASATTPVGPRTPGGP
ncbi:MULTISPECIES: MFS transporter [unclassified Streptomyces]|uniref:MFS transporter n=1 Tax=unclassified Streptomyces TaxID=2593676 RepID=UPI001BE81ECF|nr:MULTISPECIES: MFS transporter [unclassified Streptomyces]MBT2407771.1 MFS transporter [Streptomyces sp. ISL-21]MBT2613776.1 MFS transporter [Streptomyces sp. ISL-87]